MSAVGLPGLNGFVGEFLVLAGTFITHRWWAVVATTAIVSGAIYLLWAYQRVFHGPIRIEANAAVRDISWREIAAVAPLLAGIVFLGVYPRPFLDRVTPSVNHLLAHVQAVDPSAHVPPSGQAPISYSVPPDQNVDSSVRTTGTRGVGTGGARATAVGQVRRRPGPGPSRPSRARGRPHDHGAALQSSGGRLAGPVVERLHRAAPSHPAAPG